LPFVVEQKKLKEAQEKEKNEKIEQMQGTGTCRKYSLRTGSWRSKR